MAKWRALADLYQGRYIPAGTIFTDVIGDPAQMIGGNYVPSAYFEPLDAAAVAIFYATGPQLTGGSVPIVVSPPATKWIADPNGGVGNPYRQYVLTGLGAGMPMQQLGTGGVLGLGGQFP
jgi:hypothetical protein